MLGWLTVIVAAALLLKDALAQVDLKAGLDQFSALCVLLLVVTALRAFFKHRLKEAPKPSTGTETEADKTAAVRFNKTLRGIAVRDFLLGVPFYSLVGLGIVALFFVLGSTTRGVSLGLQAGYDRNGPECTSSTIYFPEGSEISLPRVLRCGPKEGQWLVINLNIDCLKSGLPDDCNNSPIIVQIDGCWESTARQGGGDMGFIESGRPFQSWAEPKKVGISIEPFRWDGCYPSDAGAATVVAGKGGIKVEFLKDW